MTQPTNIPESPCAGAVDRRVLAIPQGECERAEESPEGLRGETRPAAVPAPKDVALASLEAPAMGPRSETEPLSSPALDALMRRLSRARGQGGPAVESIEAVMAGLRRAAIQGRVVVATPTAAGGLLPSLAFLSPAASVVAIPAEEPAQGRPAAGRCGNGSERPEGIS